jgi:hypothetical protein
MRSMGTRRVALFAGAAAVAAVALAGCSAGQIAETSLKKPSTYGVNVDNADGSVLLRGVAVTYGSIKGYPAGGTAPVELSLFNETSAPISVQISSEPLTGADPSQGVVSAKLLALVGPAPSAGASAGPAEVEPTGSRNAARPLPTESDPAAAASNDPSAEPSASPTAKSSVKSSAKPGVEPSADPSASPTTDLSTARPAQITIPALESVVFRPGDAQTLQLLGLSGPLVPGNSVNLVFKFSNGVTPLVLQAPVSVPLSPAPRASAEAEHQGVSEE